MIGYSDSLACLMEEWRLRGTFWSTCKKWRGRAALADLGTRHIGYAASRRLPGEVWSGKSSVQCSTPELIWWNLSPRSTSHKLQITNTVALKHVRTFTDLISQDRRARSAVCLWPFEVCATPCALLPLVAWRYGLRPNTGRVAGAWPCMVVLRNCQWTTASPVSSQCQPVGNRGDRTRVRPVVRLSRRALAVLVPPQRAAGPNLPELGLVSLHQPSSKHSLSPESNLHLFPTTNHLLTIFWNHVQILPKRFCLFSSGLTSLLITKFCASGNFVPTTF